MCEPNAQNAPKINATPRILVAFSKCVFFSHSLAKHTLSYLIGGLTT